MTVTERGGLAARLVMGAALLWGCAEAAPSDADSVQGTVTEEGTARTDEHAPMSTDAALQGRLPPPGRVWPFGRPGYGAGGPGPIPGCADAYCGPEEWGNAGPWRYDHGGSWPQRPSFDALCDSFRCDYY